MITESDPRHGSENGYSAGCREFCCKRAHAQYNAKKKAERIARGIPEAVHGTLNGYANYGCHCVKCQIASIGT